MVHIIPFHVWMSCGVLYFILFHFNFPVIKNIVRHITTFISTLLSPAFSKYLFVLPALCFLLPLGTYRYSCWSLAR